MFTLQFVIVISGIALLLGAGVCYFALNFFGKQQQLNKNLEEKLRQAEKTYTDYQTEVTEHFIETSKRVNNLTKNYKEVHEYLASSAMKLANPNLSQNILEEANSNLPGPGSIIEGQTTNTAQEDGYDEQTNDERLSEDDEDLSNAEDEIEAELKNRASDDTK